MESTRIGINMLKKVMTYLSVSYLALWSVFFPDTAHAVVNKIKCEQMPNKFWHPAIAKSYARGIMQMHYNWGVQNGKPLINCGLSSRIGIMVPSILKQQMMVHMLVAYHKY